MSWSYTDPSTNNRDKVRFLAGLTDVNDQLVSDEEIGAFITDFGLVATDAPVSTEVNLLRQIAANICDAIALKFARQVDTKNLSLSVSRSQRSKQFKDCARTLRGLAGISQTEQGTVAVGAEMFVGGTSINEKVSRKSNTDEVQPYFERGRDDNPRAGGQDTRINSEEEFW